MNNPLISIIVTTFNRPDMLVETVRSLLNQTYQRFEILVVDNFSTADVGAVLKRMGDERIRFFKNDNRGIIAGNRNVGIRQARGEMLAFCDDDDLWFPHKLERQLDLFDAARHIGVGSSWRIIGGGASHRCLSLLTGGDRGFAELLKYGAPPLSSLMVRQTGALFSEDKRFRNVEDFEFQIRLVHQTGKTIGIEEAPLIYYRVHATNQNRDRAQRLNVIHVIKDFKKHISRDLFHCALARQYFLAGLASLRGREPTAAAYFRKSTVFSKGVAIKARLGYCVSHLPVFLWGLPILVFYGSMNIVRVLNPFSRPARR